MSFESFLLFLLTSRGGRKTGRPSTSVSIVPSSLILTTPPAFNRFTIAGSAKSLAVRRTVASSSPNSGSTRLPLPLPSRRACGPYPRTSELYFSIIRVREGIFFKPGKSPVGSATSPDCSLVANPMRWKNFLSPVEPNNGSSIAPIIFDPAPCQFFFTNSPPKYQSAP